MTPSDQEPEAARWQRVEALLDQALELPASERPALLDQACGDDAPLRNELESLLVEVEQTAVDGFLEQPALAAFAEIRPEAGDPLGLVGRMVAHYRVVAHVGSGGMGVVYKAEDTRLNRSVALKFLPLGGQRIPEATHRFVHEARAAAALNHPNICTIHAIDETEAGQAFIAMEYVEGRDLKQKLTAGPLPLEEVQDVALQVARGLQEAHARGIIHRDIKSANIMTTYGGQVKVMDFGLAKLGEGTQLTRAGSTIGTVAYMSPEQARGEAVDRRSDLFSLGVVLYELLTGVLPFRGGYEAAVLYEVLNKSPEPLVSHRPEAGRWQGILDKALAKEPKARYQRVEEIIVDLERIRLGRPPEPRHRSRPGGAPSRHAPIMIGVLAILISAGSFVGYRAFSSNRLPRLTITSTPAGATVYVGGEVIGVTPFVNRELEELREGEHKLRLEMLGYLSVDTLIEVAAGEQMTFNFAMAERLASVDTLSDTVASPKGLAASVHRPRVKGPPDANVVVPADTTGGKVEAIRALAASRVSVGALSLNAVSHGEMTLDGKPVGPGVLLLDAGRHSVTCGRDPFRADTTLTVQADRATSLTCHFQSTVNMVTIREGSPAPWASVWVDSVYVQDTPYSRPMEVGSYRIEVRREGYEILDGDTTLVIRPTFKETTHRLSFRVQ